jgi:eukaryotic-like serine/threonine-protein kinase
VVHRDIKPENIMLRRDGLVKVVDFGLAKLSEQQTANLETNLYTTAPGIVIGTLPYMSPEQARGLPLDGRTDIWSLGVVLYELAGGILPFAGNTMSDVIAAILMKDPPALTKHARGVPLELERIVNKALSKDLEERYQLAEDLGKDLRTLKHRSELEEERKASGDQVDNDRRVTTELTHERKRSYDTRAIHTERGRAKRRNDVPSIIEYLWRKPRRRSGWLLLALIPLLTVAGWWLFTLLGLLGRQRSNDESTRSVEIVPFTSFPGDERLPSFSPDGSRVAFAWNGEEGNTDIYIKQVGTEALQRLTTDVAPDTQPRWSPNGLYIAFLRQKAEAYELYLIPSIGGAERKLTELALVEPVRLDVIQIGWSPDSKWLAVSDRGSPDEPYSIFMVGRESGEKTRLTQGADYSPAVSPDGRNIAYRHFEIGGVSEIYVKPVTGGEPKRLTFSDDVKSSPAWTPDGREILFLSETGGSVATVWRMPATGGTPARVEGAGQGVTSFALSPKGDRLALAQTISDSNIWQVELQGSGLPTAESSLQRYSSLPPGQTRRHSSLRTEGESSSPRPVPATRASGSRTATDVILSCWHNSIEEGLARRDGLPTVSGSSSTAELKAMLISM